MTNEAKRREPGKRVFPSRQRPKLTLVPSPKPSLPDVRTELSEEVRKMLREMNRRYSATRNSDAPDAA